MLFPRLHPERSIQSLVMNGSLLLKTDRNAGPSPISDFISDIDSYVLSYSYRIFGVIRILDLDLCASSYRMPHLLIFILQMPIQQVVTSSCCG